MSTDAGVIRRWIGWVTAAIVVVVVVTWIIQRFAPGNVRVDLSGPVEIGPTWQTFSKSLFRLKRYQQIAIRIPEGATYSKLGLLTKDGEVRLEARLVRRNGEEVDLGLPSAVGGPHGLEYVTFRLPADVDGLWFSGVRIRGSTKVRVTEIVWDCFTLLA